MRLCGLSAHIRKKKKIIDTLLGKLLKKKLENVNVNLIIAHCEDISQHLEDNIEDDEYKTT